MWHRVLFVACSLAVALCCQAPARAERSLPAILVPAMLGSTVAELERHTGAVVEVHQKPDGQQIRTYDVRHCNFYASVRDGRIESFELGLAPDLEGRCTTELGPFLGVTLPSADRMTLGDFIRAVGLPAEVGQQTFGMSCITVRDCGDHEQPTAEFFWRGPQGIDVQLSIVAVVQGEGGVDPGNPAAVVAASAWEVVMRRIEGRGYVANARFNCDNRYQREGVRLFDAALISAVRIGQGLGDGQSYANRCH